MANTIEPTKFRVTNNTTLEQLEGWLDLRPNIEALRIRKPSKSQKDPMNRYRAIIILTDETPVMGEPFDSLIEAVSSVVDYVDDLFPL
jgi:hypothetical protein